MHGKQFLQCALLITVSLSGCQLIGIHRGIHEAVKYGDLARVEELLQNDPNLVNSIDPENGTSPLYLAAANNEVQIAETLLKHGATVDTSNQYGTALHVASDEGHLEIMQLLMRNGADPLSQQNDWKLSPLHYAAWGGHEEAVRLLLAAGARVISKDIFGRTPLHRAHEKSVAALLIANGADVNARDDKGWTCLHWAASSRERYSLETIKLLLEKGADSKLKDLNGKTAVELARDSEKPDLATLLDISRLARYR